MNGRELTMPEAFPVIRAYIQCVNHVRNSNGFEPLDDDQVTAMSEEIFQAMVRQEPRDNWTDIAVKHGKADWPEPAKSRGYVLDEEREKM